MALLDTLEKQIDGDEQQDIISGAAGAIIVLGFSFQVTALNAFE